jgi:tRNA threonylcarbamoyladenosine biosynthesis protein TsaB
MYRTCPVDRRRASRYVAGMRVLALDTATFTASVALLEDDRILAEGDARVSTHSEQLLPLVEDVLRRAGLRAADVDALACGSGPGSFTGLRIGLATAKGLCFALGKPLVLVSSLAALSLEAPSGMTVLALLDARKREVYAGLYRREGHQAAALVAEAVLPPAQLGQLVGAENDLVVVGDGAAAYPAEAGRVGRVLDRRQTPGGAAVARLAMARLEAGPIDELLTGEPTYVRPSEVDMPKPRV